VGARYFLSRSPKGFLATLDQVKDKDGVVRVCSTPLTGRRSALLYAHFYFGRHKMTLRCRVPRAKEEEARADLEAEVRRRGLAVRAARVEAWMPLWKE
jgi:hypothetical protein